MKSTRKILALLLCLAMLFSLAACDPAETPAENTDPAIKGVADSSVQAGSEFDALAGVTASDAEDGDLTAKIVVTSMPELSFTNGKATPAVPGTYELNYIVKDSAGKGVKAYATLTVTRKTAEATELENMDFSANYTPNNHGWNAYIAEGLDAKAELKQGAYVFEIGNPSEGATANTICISNLQFGSAETADMGSATIEISQIIIEQEEIL